MAQNITAKTFPGVYTQVIDRSFLLPQTSRFRAGLVGVARKGSFDTPTAIRSLQDFIRLFGQPLTGDYFLANAVAILSDLSDGMKVVRVGKQTTENVGATFSNTAFSTVGTVTPFNKALVLLPSVQGGGVSSPSVYATIRETGKLSTINAQVVTAGTSAATSVDAGTVAFTGVLQDVYAAASVFYSVGAPAASAAEAVLYAYTYGTNAGDFNDAGIFSGAFQLTATGNKGDFQFTLSPASAFYLIPAGTLIKIKQTGKATTHEALVKQSLPDGTIYLETTDRQDTGYQALSLQDSYSGATIHKQTGRQPYLYLEAASAGDWASPSSASSLTSGLFVKVRPGGVPGTKKFEIYEDGGLQETIDGLYNGSGTNTFAGRINGKSQEIVVSAQTGTISDMQPANYSYGWQSNASLINAGVGSSGASFAGGANGEGALASDFVGRFDPAQEKFTGMQSFIDTDNMQIDVLCCPGITDAVAGGGNDTVVVQSTEPFADTDTTGVHMKMVEVCRRINALALIDVPPGLSARQAIDWHNGHGLYAGRGRIDSPNGSVFWNWFTITDPFSQQDKWVPPTLGALRCLAFTFDRDKPWYAAAGDTRGLIPEAKVVENERVSDDTKQAMYGNGQSINGIFLDRGQIKLWGERTLQVAESKLSVNHNVILVNYVVNNLAEIGRRFVFEPNDAELLMRIRLAFSQFLDKVANERGIELPYNLVVDNSNNTADTRNRREVIVNLDLVPVDTAERIFITATVRESGAVLNNASSE